MLNKAKNDVSKSDELLFVCGAAVPGADVEPREAEQLSPWKVMIVDDDQVVHDVSAMVLEDFYYQGRALQIITGYSGDDAKRLMREHPDTAILLLDVVMETDNAGLEAVRYIREELNNRFVRIILRTGQPGDAPESEVIHQYDINDYKEKSDLTVQKLQTALVVSLRNYSDLKTINELSNDNEMLEQRIKERTRALEAANKNLLLEIDERVRVNNALKKSKQRLAEAQRIANIGNWEWDLKRNEMNWSDQMYRIFEYDPQEVCASYDNLLSAVVMEDRVAVARTLEKASRLSGPFEISHRARTLNGDLRYVKQRGQVNCDENGEVIRIAGTVQDMTERFRAEEQMRKLSSAVEQTTNAVMITDSQGVIEYVNPAFVEMTGYSKSEILGKTPRKLKSGKQSDAFYKRLWKTITKGEVFREVIINRKKNGMFFYEEKTITPQTDSNGLITHFISTSKDITERMETQARLHHLAHHDALTGLPNRTLLQDRLSQAISRARWHGRNVAVLFLDTDRFKIINDTLGHSAGDQLLLAMSERLNENVREGDTVARLGGDEFAIILNDIANKRDVEPSAKKILNALEKPYYLDSHELFVTTSIGISLFPINGEDTQSLLKKADVAMYRAKEAGRNTYEYYTDEDDNKAVERLSLETNLRRALEREEFLLHYQPQLNLSNGMVESVEALLRWQHSEFQLVSPMHFIPLLEDTGMILPVGEWVLRTACQRERARQAAGLFPQRIAVNISVRQFRHKNFVERVESILDETRLHPQWLELEVTEGLLIENMAYTADVLQQLHEMGIHLSIDDFGTGYSSMNYLKRLPFDTLKIDRSFIKDITHNADDAAITTSIIMLAHNMNLSVVAEGVESVDQLQFLQKQGCDVIQGYLYSPPLTAEALNAFTLQSQKHWQKLSSTCKEKPDTVFSDNPPGLD